MSPWLREWSGFFGLLVLGWLLRTLLAAVYRGVRDRVDAKIPDDMPLTAGLWLHEQVLGRNVDVAVLAAPSNDSGLDAFLPSARTIILSRDVYEKQDASFWAIAAHELGHALVYRRAPPLHGLLFLARILSTSCTELGTFLIVANVLYARRDIDALAFQLLSASLVAYLFVLLDEAIASSVALAILARDERVSRRGFVGAVTGLVAAFMTYLGGFVGQLVLVLQRDFVIAQIERHRQFVAGHPIGGAAFIAVLLASIFLVIFSARELWGVLRRPPVKSFDELGARRKGAAMAGLGRSVLGAGIVWLVWDQARGPMFALFCVAGLLAGRELYRGLVGIGTEVVSVVSRVLVFFIAAVVLIVVFMLYASVRRARSQTPPTEPAPEKAAPPAAAALATAPAALSVVPYVLGGPMGGDTRGAMEAIQMARENDPPWYERGPALFFPALHIAFAVGVVVQLVNG